MTKQSTHAENSSTIFFICLVAGEREKGGGREGRGRVGEKNNSGNRQEWRQIGQKRNVSADGRGEEWQGRREEDWRGVEEKGGDSWKRREIAAGGREGVGGG